MTDLMKDLEGIAVFALDQLREAQRTSDAVSLPFPAPYIYAHNGDPRSKSHAQTCPVLYFGGWATDQTALGELIEDGSVPGALKGWTAFSGANDKGEYSNVGARALTFSFVGHRDRWLNSEGRASHHFNKETGHTRRHIQVLALLYSDSKPWGYAVLVAKGYQAIYFYKALEAWKKAITPFLKELNGTQLPISAFAITIGNTGEAPTFEKVGKTAQSSITPLAAIIPADLNAEKVAKRFIGAANIAANAERLGMAKEWLAAWSKADDKEAPAESSNGDGGNWPPEDF